VTRSDEQLALTLTLTAAAAAVLVLDHVSTPFDALFEQESKRTGVPADLLRAIARRESGFRAGAIGKPNSNGTKDWGLMQVNDRTAAHYGVQPAQLLDPATCVRVAADYLVDLHRELGSAWSEWTWIAAYNAGAPAIKSRGVFNVTYAGDVFWNFTLYRIAALVRGKAA